MEHICNLSTILSTLYEFTHLTLIISILVNTVVISIEIKKQRQKDSK